MLNVADLESPTAVSLTDDSSVVKAAQNDPAAFAALYRSYVTPVYRYIHSRVSDNADAQDLTAQVFLEALEGLPHYHDHGNFAAWLFTIVRRRVVDHWRRQLPLSLDEVLDPADEQDLLSQVSQDETLKQLQDLVAGLDSNEQELLRLRFAARLTFEQIATVLGRKEAAVKMALHRLLRRLEAEWEGER